MKFRTILNVIVLVLLISQLNACIVVPKTVPSTGYKGTVCETVSAEWDLELVGIGGSVHNCTEGCLLALAAAPVVSIIVSAPIVLVGNSINYIEKQIRCN
jgi:hypothetical protein